MDFQTRTAMALDGLAAVCADAAVAEALEDLEAIVTKGPEALQELKDLTNRIGLMTSGEAEEVEQEAETSDQPPPASEPNAPEGEVPRSDPGSDPGATENVAPV